MNTQTQSWIQTGVNLVNKAVTMALGWVDGLMKGTGNVKWLFYIVAAVVAFKVLPGLLGKRGRR